jgi:hypothetical protein
LLTRASVAVLVLAFFSADFLFGLDREANTALSIFLLLALLRATSRLRANLLAKALFCEVDSFLTLCFLLVAVLSLLFLFLAVEVVVVFYFLVAAGFGFLRSAASLLVVCDFR